MLCLSVSARSSSKQDNKSIKMANSSLFLFSLLVVAVSALPQQQFSARNLAAIDPRESIQEQVAAAGELRKIADELRALPAEDVDTLIGDAVAAFSTGPTDIKIGARESILLLEATANFLESSTAPLLKLVEEFNNAVPSA